MSAPDAPDRIDRAIVAAEPPEIPTVTFEVQLSSGRAAAIRVPANITPQEAIDLIGMIAKDLPRALVEMAMKAGARTIDTPRGPHLVRPS